jgi:hypothetical protein
VAMLGISRVSDQSDLRRESRLDLQREERTWEQAARSEKKN